MTMSVQKDTKARIGQVFALLAATLLLGLFMSHSCAAEPVPSLEVWTAAQEYGEPLGIDPLLIYAIACAESSLDAHASSGQARGLMQMTKRAWTEVTDRDYDDAWDWRLNLEMAAAYLDLLKKRLEKSGHYSWPLLACAYRYGPGAVEKAGFDTTQLPPERNLIYKALFCGKTPSLPDPAPLRDIVAIYPPQPSIEEPVRLPDRFQLFEPEAIPPLLPLLSSAPDDESEWLGDDFMMPRPDPSSTTAPETETP